MPSQRAYTFALVVYSKPKATEESVTINSKSKGLLFTVSDDNYMDFLRGILDNLKHQQSHYRVSEEKRFPFTFVLPKTKSLPANGATEVHNEADYQEMVKTIHNTNPSMTKIYVDMQQIEELPSGNPEDSEASDADVSQSPSHSPLDLDAPLARWRLKLQNRYKNANDAGLTYVGPMGAISLTPGMILDWCCALEEGEATLATPPSLELFNTANKAQLPVPATPSVDVNLLISILLLLTLMNFGLLSTASPSHPTATNAPAPPPAMPTRTPAETPTPSHLTRFLHYAETHLGVRDATTYKRDLELHGIGPDVFADIDDKTLAGIGISTGDVIRLKKGSLIWWNSPEGKRKRSNTAPSSGTDDRTSDAQPPRKRVAYEKRYRDGTKHRFWGPPVRPVL